MVMLNSNRLVVTKRGSTLLASESELGRALIPTNFTAKPLEILTIKTPLKGQAERIRLIDDSEDFLDEYKRQRARGAYIASIRQPEGSYDLSVTAQCQKASKDNVKALNKRLERQIKNKSRGLNFIHFQLKTAKLLVFVDASFANNEDVSSQIGYMIIKGNEEAGADEFRVVGNVIHWSSIKCKRVT
ncbi:hypothetical protein K3495_g9526 [Podosphaera aphanis]|nr:hypothetical protein K3495_g9526 [Podosphaera aphanis]